MLKRHTHFYSNNLGMHFDDQPSYIFRNGWIDCRDAFHAFLC